MTPLKNDFTQVTVVVPCYKVRRHILGVLQKIGQEVSRIIVVDDKCPEQTGQFVKDHCQDPRLMVLFHETNKGVGGAVMTGYRSAIELGSNVIVKIDGDGQMDPRLIQQFIQPILDGRADYTKGNRFFDFERLASMPWIRLLGNAALSFLSKLSTGYWDIYDPTNGFTAIHARVASHLPFGKMSERYFFESDILFRLGTLRAVVLDVPMDSNYGDEESHLEISKIIGEFLVKHVRNLLKRIVYNYYLRGISLASLELPLGGMLLFFGLIYGTFHWYWSVNAGIATPAGTVMLSALPILLGLQFVLAFISHDIKSVPSFSINQRLGYLPTKAARNS
ncbi:MAG: glycosyltransferase family 2 protein [Elusimicrobia bacterium]|nr:glycosyltransferase family 2 protein [Elusimicrobiota bacterium]